MSAPNAHPPKIDLKHRYTIADLFIKIAYDEIETFQSDDDHWRAENFKGEAYGDGCKEDAERILLAWIQKAWKVDRKHFDALGLDKTELKIRDAALDIWLAYRRAYVQYTIDEFESDEWDPEIFEHQFDSDAHYDETVAEHFLSENKLRWLREEFYTFGKTYSLQGKEVDAKKVVCEVIMHICQAKNSEDRNNAELFQKAIDKIEAGVDSGIGKRGENN